MYTEMEKREEEELKKTEIDREEEEDDDEVKKTECEREEEEEEEEEEEVVKETAAEREEEEDDDNEEIMETAAQMEEGGGGATDEGDDDSHEDAKKSLKKKPKLKVGGAKDSKCVPGIIYLGHIPPRLRPKHLRNLLSVYGEIGRIFLQPEDKTVRIKKKKSGLRRCDFTEGWVEFRDKRVAKRVAASLHSTPMGTRKRQRFASDLWCIKYLHRFQWTHLSERLAYEHTVLQQRLRTEVSQAKRETNFYLSNVDKGAHMDKERKKRQRDGAQVDEKTWDFTQRRTEEEIQTMKKKKQGQRDSITQKHLDKARLIEQKSQSNVSLLAKIFNSKQSE